ncbi:hypothetical protein Gohar_006144 [Gossypium harknessii]|uniref:NADH dehydrogenase subunit 4L n=1 Tax=Gossypium harknessii TaxID=34285 RepID=A0A7J9GCH5_9ROSI|nr:hypothetical protein [Gossypium harknessii]
MMISAIVLMAPMNLVHPLALLQNSTAEMLDMFHCSCFLPESMMGYAIVVMGVMSMMEE